MSGLVKRMKLLSYLLGNSHVPFTYICTIVSNSVGNTKGIFIFQCFASFTYRVPWWCFIVRHFHAIFHTLGRLFCLTPSLNVLCDSK